MVITAKTGRVASNGFRLRQPGKIICFFHLGSQPRLILLLCYLQKEEQGGAWIHISTIKETVARLGWPEEHLCGTDKGGALAVPHSICLSYSMAHSVYENLGSSQDPFLKCLYPQSHAYRQPARVHESRSGVMQLLHTSDEGSRVCSCGLLSLAVVICFRKSGLSSLLSLQLSEQLKGSQNRSDFLSFLL